MPPPLCSPSSIKKSPAAGGCVGCYRHSVTLVHLIPIYTQKLKTTSPSVVRQTCRACFHFTGGCAFACVHMSIHVPALSRSTVGWVHVVSPIRSDPRVRRRYDSIDLVERCDHCLLQSKPRRVSNSLTLFTSGQCVHTFLLPVAQQCMFHPTSTSILVTTTAVAIPPRLVDALVFSAQDEIGGVGRGTTQ